MHKRQTAVLETLRSIQGFLDDNRTTVAPVNESDARHRGHCRRHRVVQQVVETPCRGEHDSPGKVLRRSG